ncbi:hypothetical protein ALC57_06569 [Trachymyrmex cornetzi]|uniref:Uncharacterized protein n=1 Tax=Trachymyrmex cornetzi TaxID=471704 RepID=A0A151J894_9HYME|nr:hypothetical protein ALC57_06569 [Trachymyrmex cornetzi]
MCSITSSSLSSRLFRVTSLVVRTNLMSSIRAAVLGGGVRTRSDIASYSAMALDTD